MPKGGLNTGALNPTVTIRNGVSRVTIARPAFAKIKNQLERREDLAPVKKALENTKITFTEKNDAVLWDPLGPLASALAKILVREQGFARNREGHNYKVTQESIERLQDYVGEKPSTASNP